MWTQQAVFFKEMWEQRSRHQVLGKNMAGEALQAPTIQKLFKLHNFQSRVHA
jgi:hypothetical protein